MASSIIHMVVANEVNKKMNRDVNKILIGSIAPDISKHIGQSKKESHFLDDTEYDVPNIERFLTKYKNNLDDDFVLGYFIHLYTDYLWFKYFVPEFYNANNNMITKLDGSKVKLNGEMFALYLYNDYTNLNVRLIDEYNMDLSIFYNEIPKLDNIITEIPIEKIDIIINKASTIIENSKIKKEYVIDLTNVKAFIELSIKLTIAKLDEILC